MKNNFNIKNLTSFKIGGNVEKVYFPKSINEFVEILKNEPNAKVLGQISDTLISSYGYNGTIILTSEMNNFNITENIVTVECGVKGPYIANEIKNLSGFEFMIGFPGSIGGNIYMNASANNQCISDKLISVQCFDGTKIIEYSKDDLNFSYRHSLLQDKNLIVLTAKFKLDKTSSDEVKNKKDECLSFRKTHQPLLNSPNCGSVFKNPQDNSAGKLLDSIGAKSMSVNDAKVWDNHANFIINTNNATSTDVLELMTKMSNEVEKVYNIKLIPEIRFLGNTNKYEEELCKKLKIELI